MSSLAESAVREGAVAGVTVAQLQALAAGGAPIALPDGAWFLIDQSRIDTFAQATDDADPLHVDPDWARREGPFGTTIAHGFLTLSLLTTLLREGTGLPGGGGVHRAGYTLNYGLEHVRFVHPVAVGARVRARSCITAARRRDDGRWLCEIDITVDIRDATRPALVARWLTLLAFAADGDAPGDAAPTAAAPSPLDRSGSHAVILFAHGARDARWSTTLQALAGEVAAGLPGSHVATAFLEFQPPTLASAIGIAIERGAREIDVVPVFWASGGHVANDVPPLLAALRAAHPQLSLRLLPVLSELPDMLGFIARAVITAAHQRAASPR